MTEEHGGESPGRAGRAGPEPRSGSVRGDGASGSALRRFRRAYGRHRAREGRGTDEPEELLALPYPDDAAFPEEWRVRARTYERFLARVVDPLTRDLGTRALRVLDLGAGNGWLSARLIRRDHRPVALDLRTDDVDGLGAARALVSRLPRPLPRVGASFEALPFADDAFDVVVYNAALHYAVDLERTLTEAGRVVRRHGRVAVLDSPFYRSEEAGEAMVAEKRRRAPDVFGDLAGELMALPVVEYLTPGRLEEASRSIGLRWRRHRVLYPLWYELRPLKALLKRRRPPSRFDLWVGAVP